MTELFNHGKTTIIQPGEEDQESLLNQEDLPLSGITVLIVDLDTSYLRYLKGTFSEFGAKVSLAHDFQNAVELIQSHQFHVAISEFFLDSHTGIELFPEFQKHQTESLFYLMSNQLPAKDAVQSMKLGVTDFLEKPLDVPGIAKNLFEILQSRSTAIAPLDPLTEMLKPFLIFRSNVMRQGLSVLPKLAVSHHSVLITGETGTGKEMVAHAIHRISPRSGGPFIAINCGAIPENLIEGELFGHEKGAFTGANATRKGKFELAQRGTLFLDEIGEMPLALQVRLLRALEEGQIYRVGGEKPIPVDVRIVAATRVTLEESVENGLFREDLYYRLNVLRIQLPPLRDRKEDIPLLAWHFLERAFGETAHSKPYPTLGREAIKVLLAYPWKGNVRELRNMMTRIAILLPYEARQILPDHILPELTGFAPPYQRKEEKMMSDGGYVIDANPAENQAKGIFIPVGTTMKEAEELLIQATLEETDGNKTKAAKILDIGLRTIRRRLNE